MNRANQKGHLLWMDEILHHRSETLAHDDSTVSTNQKCLSLVSKWCERIPQPSTDMNSGPTRRIHRAGRSGGLFATFGEKIGDPLNKEFLYQGVDHFSSQRWQKDPPEEGHPTPQPELGAVLVVAALEAVPQVRRLSQHPMRRCNN